MQLDTLIIPLDTRTRKAQRYAILQNQSFIPSINPLQVSLLYQPFHIRLPHIQLTILR
jgi:hypothetical protein